MAIYRDMPDADYRAMYRDHMNVSSFKDWERCGAAQWEVECGTWKRPEKDCFTEGKFAHTSLFQPELLPQFIADNLEIIASTGKTKGELKAAYKDLAECVRLMREDPYFGEFAGGEVEVSFTGEIDGVPWCVRADNVHFDRFAFDDAKFMKDFKPTWKTVEGHRICLPWYDDYWVQIAVYRHIIKQNIPGDWVGRLLAITKQSPPARDALIMDCEEKLESAMWRVREFQPQIIQWRKEMLKPAGEVENVPAACMDLEDCEYCRQYSTLKLRKAV